MARIIAECCQNHRGDLAVLKDMIWSAAEAGADYVKIQSIRADELTYRPEFEEGIVVDGQRRAIQRPYDPEFARLRPLDLDDEAHIWFVEECRRAGVQPLTTAFTRERVPFLATLSWSAIKVASYDCASQPLLRDLADHFDHLFISTGATYDEEVEATADALAGRSYTFLHCVTIYPTPLDALNLARLGYLSRLAPSVGFSDHSLTRRDGIKASVVAMLLGADVIERHYTVLGEDATKDGPVSIGPQQLAELALCARMSRSELIDYIGANVGDYSMMIGHEHRELSAEELLNRNYYRGRFASRSEGEVFYNWEERRVSSDA